MQRRRRVAHVDVGVDEPDEVGTARRGARVARAPRAARHLEAHQSRAGRRRGERDGGGVGRPVVDDGDPLAGEAREQAAQPGRVVAHRHDDVDLGGGGVGVGEEEARVDEAACESLLAGGDGPAGAPALERAARRARDAQEPPGRAPGHQPRRELLEARLGREPGPGAQALVARGERGVHRRSLPGSPGRGRMGDEEVVVTTIEVTVASGEVEELLVEEVSIDGLCGVY